jgi:hypothetical protein
MSTALAIAGVTAVLRDLLNDELVNSKVAGIIGQSVTVTTLPPDRVVPENGPENSQLNIFLRHATPNLGRRNEGLPSRDITGRSRLTNAPLALDLHYLISAYGAEPLHAEILLGYAMQLLHENPAVPREALRTSLQQAADPNHILPSALQALAGSGLADQVEQLRITPEYLDNENMSKFWTATLAHYRPCAAYQVSVVLIQKERPAPSALPVLVRNVRVNPSVLPSAPVLTGVIPSAKLPVVELDRPVTLEGFNLAGTSREVLLTNDRFRIDEALPGSGTPVDKMEFTIPGNRAADFPVGVYWVGARLQANGDDRVRPSNLLALTIAPSIDGLPLTVTRTGTTADFNLSFKPALRAGQTARLVLGLEEFAPEPFTGASTTTLHFVIPDALVADHPVRLRIDGIDSPMIDVEATPPTFNKKIKIQ